MRFKQIESVLQTKNRSELAKNQFSVALTNTELYRTPLTIYILIPNIFLCYKNH